MSNIEWTDTLKRRFWGYVDRRETSECWPWKAGLFSRCYGQFRAGTKKVRAHRAAYEALHGPVPSGLIVCHKCDNRKCCNPAHLFVGTHVDNARDRNSKGRNAPIRIPPQPGERNPAAKLTRATVDRIRRDYARGNSQRALARAYGISPSQIGNIVRRTSWQ